MKTVVDLSGLKTSGEVLSRFGEIFEFGGPNGNIKISTTEQRNGWGLNWDAFNDSLRYLEKGGIWGTSKKFEFPLEIELINSGEFQNDDPKSFDILKDIMRNRAEEYAKKDKMLTVKYA